MMKMVHERASRLRQTKCGLIPHEAFLFQNNSASSCLNSLLSIQVKRTFHSTVFYLNFIVPFSIVIYNVQELHRTVRVRRRTIKQTRQFVHGIGQFSSMVVPGTKCCQKISQRLFKSKKLDQYKYPKKKAFLDEKKRR